MKLWKGIILGDGEKKSENKGIEGGKYEVCKGCYYDGWSIVFIE